MSAESRSPTLMEIDDNDHHDYYLVPSSLFLVPLYWNLRTGYPGPMYVILALVTPVQNHSLIQVTP